MNGAINERYEAHTHMGPPGKTWHRTASQTEGVLVWLLDHLINSAVFQFRLHNLCTSSFSLAPPRPCDRRPRGETCFIARGPEYRARVNTEADRARAQPNEGINFRRLYASAAGHPQFRS